MAKRADPRACASYRRCRLAKATPEPVFR